MEQEGPGIEPGSQPPVPRRDYGASCWWCEGPAGSREHRHKASDLRREFSRAEYEANDVIIRRTGVPERAITVPGPNSAAVKFDDHFCTDCNSARSQPFDRAYDRFISWFLANEHEVEPSGRMPFSEIYEDPAKGCNDLLGYFVKHLACRIADVGYAVPQGLIAFLGGFEARGLVAQLWVDGRLAAISEIMRQNPEDGTGYLGVGGLDAEVTRDKQFAHRFASSWSYHGLTFQWEWNTAHVRSWTNILPHISEIEVINEEEGRALLAAAAAEAE